MDVNIKQDPKDIRDPQKQQGVTERGRQEESFKGQTFQKGLQENVGKGEERTLGGESMPGESRGRDTSSSSASSEDIEPSEKTVSAGLGEQTKLGQQEKPSDLSDPSIMLGKWNLVESENYHDYLRALGMQFDENNPPSEEATAEFKKLDDKTWMMTSWMKINKSEWRFKLGEEGDEETPDGRKCRTMVTFENGMLRQRRQGKDDGKVDHVTRKFRDNEMEVIAEADGVKCRRRYMKAE